MLHFNHFADFKFNIHDSNIIPYFISIIVINLH